MTSTLHALGSLDAPVHARLEVAHRLLDLMDDVCVAAQRAAATLGSADVDDGWLPR